MIVGTHRFHGYGGLRSVYQRGHTVRSSMVSLRFNIRDPKRPYRAAVVVSRKVSKSAVARNRIRRRLYEWIRHQAPAIPGGTDLVFTVFDERIAELPSAKLDSTLRELLAKAAQKHL